MQCFICVSYMFVLVWARPAQNEQVHIFHDEPPEFINSFKIDTTTQQTANNEVGTSEDLESFPNELFSDDFSYNIEQKIKFPAIKLRTPKTYAIFTINEDKNDKVDAFSNNNNNNNKITVPSLLSESPLTYLTRSSNSEDNLTKLKRKRLSKPRISEATKEVSIFDRYSEISINPTIIFNIQDAKSLHNTTDINTKVSGKGDKRQTQADNYFNIRQEIRLGSIYGMGREIRKVDENEQVNNVISTTKTSANTDEDMMMCESGAPGNNDGK